MKNIYSLFLLMSLGVFAYAEENNLAQPRWVFNLDLESIEKRLMSEKVVATFDLETFIKESREEKKDDANTTSLLIDSKLKPQVVILESGLKAIFNDKKNTNFAEVAAYKLDKYFNMRITSPTVFRKLDNRDGIMQLYLESDLTYTPVKRILNNNVFDIKPNEKIKQKKLSDIIVFAFISGQAQISAANTIIQENNNVLQFAMTDNANSYYLNKTKDLNTSFRIWGKDNTNSNVYEDKAFPYNIETVISKETFKELAPELSKFLSRKDAKRVNRYLARLDKPVRYCIWQDSLWIEQENSLFKNGVRKIFPKTRRKLKALNAEVLKEIWADAYANSNELEKAHYDKLIQGILERRDLLLSEVSKLA